MSSFAAGSAGDGADRAVDAAADGGALLHEAAQRCLRRLRDERIELVRVVWADVHGTLRGKALTPAAAAKALDHGVSLVSTLLLKDSADRTAFKVFDADFAASRPDLAFAANVMLLPDPSSLVVLPWAPHQAWLRADVRHADGSASPLDPRRALRRAVERLAARGWSMRCGLEVEFHVYRLARRDPDPSLDPSQADWPGPAPALELVHPGYQLLADAAFDRADEPMAIVRRTVEGLGLPLSSIEIELGPSQFELVFDAMDALAAADAMVMLRNGVRQALRRAGYLATFMCRPPFANIMSSGWHLHHSLVETASGRNLFAGSADDRGCDPGDARGVLSDAGAHWLAGLLDHAPGMSALCVPHVDGFERFRPNAMAPQAIVWGRDNRGAMLRVVGAPGDAAARIENRLATPAANPYLALASQVAAGLDGIDRRLPPPRATASPYAAASGSGVPMLPGTLGEALDHLQRDMVLADVLGAPMLEVYLGVKRHELQRHALATDPVEWQRREYLARL